MKKILLTTGLVVLLTAATAAPTMAISDSGSTPLPGTGGTYEIIRPAQSVELRGQISAGQAGPVHRPTAAEHRDAQGGHPGDRHGRGDHDTAARPGAPRREAVLHGTQSFAQAEANALTPDLKAPPSEQVVILVLSEPPGSAMPLTSAIQVFWLVQLTWRVLSLTCVPLGLNASVACHPLAFTVAVLLILLTLYFALPFLVLVDVLKEHLSA